MADTNVGHGDIFLAQWIMPISMMLSLVPPLSREQTVLCDHPEAPERLLLLTHLKVTNLAEDVCDMDVLRAWLMELTEQVARRLRSQEIQGRTVHLKIRYSNFDTYTRTKSVSLATNATNQLWSVVSPLLSSELPDRPLCVRLLGMGVSNLQKRLPVQQSLFAEEQDERDSKLDQVADQIRSRFGTASLRRASTVQHNAEHKPLPRPD
jgi:DNA polymerase IV